MHNLSIRILMLYFISGTTQRGDIGDEPSLSCRNWKSFWRAANGRRSKIVSYQKFLVMCYAMSYCLELNEYTYSWVSNKHVYKLNFFHWFTLICYKTCRVTLPFNSLHVYLRLETQENWLKSYVAGATDIPLKNWLDVRLVIFEPL